MQQPDFRPLATDDLALGRYLSPVEFRVTTAQLIRDHRAPEWLIDPQGDASEWDDLEAINVCQIEVLETKVTGWSDYNAVIRVTPDLTNAGNTVDYLARVLVPDFQGEMMNTVNRDVTYVSVRYDPLSLICDYPDLEVESLDQLGSTEAFELGLESKLHQAFPDAEVDIIPATVSVTEIIVQHDEPWDDESPEWAMAMTDHVAAIIREHALNGGWLVAGEGY